MHRKITNLNNLQHPGKNKAEKLKPQAGGNRKPVTIIKTQSMTALEIASSTYETLYRPIKNNTAPCYSLDDPHYKLPVYYKQPHQVTLIAIRKKTTGTSMTRG